MGYVGSNGRTWEEKPEEMTQLFGNRLVPKDHPRIQFRGRLDWLQGEVVLAQAEMVERGTDPKLVAELEETLTLLRQIMRSDVLDEPLCQVTLLGLSDSELRAQSHDPERYFGVRSMTLPHHSMGVAYAHLNRLRTAARLTEEAAVAAYRPRPTQAQKQILQAMNRLSSAYHILMCRWLSGAYGGH